MQGDGDLGVSTVFGTCWIHWLTWLYNSGIHRCQKLCAHRTCRSRDQSINHTPTHCFQVVSSADVKSRLRCHITAYTVNIGIHLATSKNGRFYIFHIFFIMLVLQFSLRHPHLNLFIYPKRSCFCRSLAVERITQKVVVKFDEILRQLVSINEVWWQTAATLRGRRQSQRNQHTGNHTETLARRIIKKIFKCQHNVTAKYNVTYRDFPRIVSHRLFTQFSDVVKFGNKSLTKFKLFRFG